MKHTIFKSETIFYIFSASFDQWKFKIYIMKPSFSDRNPVVLHCPCALFAYIMPYNISRLYIHYISHYTFNTPESVRGPPAEDPAGYRIRSGLLFPSCVSCRPGINCLNVDGFDYWTRLYVTTHILCITGLSVNLICVRFVLQMFKCVLIGKYVHAWSRIFVLSWGNLVIVLI